MTLTKSFKGIIFLPLKQYSQKEEKAVILLHYCKIVCVCVCKRVQIPWESIWQFFLKLKIEGHGHQWFYAGYSMDCKEISVYVY